MPITDNDIRNAVLELFARKGLLAGDVMWMSRLEQFWAQTRLRRADLASGLAQLCTECLIDLEDQGDQVNLSLTLSGEEKARDVLLSEVDYCGRYLRQEILPTLRTRIEPLRSDRGGRREYEQYHVEFPSASR